MNQKALIVIPARMGSSRYPGKPFAEICKVALIERVWRIAKAVPSADAVVVATDDKKIFDFAESFGAQALMTSADCRTGTDRVAEAATLLRNDFGIVFSLQGDAVLTPPWVIEDLLEVMRKEPEAGIATPAIRQHGEELAALKTKKQAGSASGTLVVFDKKGYALYFSNALIPFERRAGKEDAPIYRHIGLYGYRSDALQRMAVLPEGRLEAVEKLEQLRALENNIPIRVLEVDYRGRTHGSVDYPEDVAEIEAIIKKEGELV